jgi:hypothetical protein
MKKGFAASGKHKKTYFRTNTSTVGTKYSAFVSKLSKLSEEYLSPQKTQKAAVFFIRKILGGRMS